MKKTWLIVCIILFVVFVIPYAKVEILSINAEEKLKDFDISCYDNIYCEGTPKVYDCKIFEYRKEEYAKVFYVFGDCEYGVMSELEWNHQNGCWDDVGGYVMWSVHGGNASEYSWPLYYPLQALF